MTLIEFLITFSFMVVLGSLFVVGFYVSSRGDWYVMPDGSFKKQGMIFKEWNLFWEQPSRKVPEERVFYKGEPLIEKWALLKKVRPDLHAKYVPSAFHDNSFMARPEAMLDRKDMEAISDVLACQVSMDSMKYFRLYQIEYRYMFPSWIRKPISECVICMSSIYGSMFYWFVVLQMPTVFRWSCSPGWAKFGFWGIFCLILACANKYIAQKMKL